MNPMLQQFLAVALPIMITFVATIWVAQWSQNKRFDDLRGEMTRGFEAVTKRLDQIEARLLSIESKLSDHGERITRLEERLTIVRR